MTETFEDWTLEQIALSRAYCNKISISWWDMIHCTDKQLFIFATNR